VTGRFPLARLADALAASRDPAHLKVVVELDGPHPSLRRSKFTLAGIGNLYLAEMYSGVYLFAFLAFVPVPFRGESYWNPCPKTLGHLITPLVRQPPIAS
jgi:hypothetical protein